MKILFVWTGVTSYMADCWRALQSVPGVTLKVVVEQAVSGSEFAAARTLKGLDCVLVEGSGSSEGLASLGDWVPDVIFGGGWRSQTTRQMLSRYADVPKVFCLDMPWRWSLRCFAARFVLWRFLRQFAAIYVPGASAAFYARWLGFAKSRIHRKLYAIDQSRLRTPAPTGARQGFLYVGRYAPEKRVDLIEKAYARYRELGGTWTLNCYGQGGKFVQADGMPKVYAEHACLLLASSFDPWPLVMLEARSAGLKVIASDRCGNCDELGAIKVPYGDVEAMAREMMRVEKREGCEKGEGLEEYDCPVWAKRTLEIARGLRQIGGWCPGLLERDNGMAVVARLLSDDTRFSREYIVHGAWLPRGWWESLTHLGNFMRMTHGSLSPVYLEGQGKWKKRLVGPVERFFLRRAKKVLATCAAEAEWIRAYEPKAWVEVVDLKPFFDLRGEGRRTKGEARTGRPLHVLYLGRRHPLKGVRFLERAVEELNGEATSSSLQQKESSSLFRSDEDVASPLVSLRVESELFGEEKEKVWEWCDVLCLPTLSENFGLVVAEALERGKDVVTTDGAPAWEPPPKTAEVERRGEGGGGQWWDRLVYLRGYRDGTDEERVKLIEGALREKANDHLD